MIKPRAYRWLPECDRCLLATGNPMQPCRLHPQETIEDPCPDFREAPDSEPNCAPQAPAEPNLG